MTAEQPEAKGAPEPHLPENSLLASLSARDYARLQPHLRVVELEREAVVYEAGDEVDWVYFPEEALLSLVSPMLSGATVETGIVGREGGIGFIEANGSGITSARVIVQIPGRALRAPVNAYCDAYDSSKAMRTGVTGSIELLVAEMRQAVACRTLHSVEQRLCWWLLEIRERARLEELPLTQEFLGAMLGVQRTTVTSIARRIQAAGYISYHRGLIKILDRAGLERCTCECYATIREVRENIEKRRRRLTHANYVRG